MKRTLLTSLAFLLGAQLATADDAALQQAIAGKHRTEAYAARDDYRHPLQTLKLFDIQPQHTVMEIWPGGGWYTEILAPYLKEEGKFIAAHYDENDKQASYRAGSRQRFEKKMAADADIFGKVEVASLMFNEETGELAIAPVADGSVDRIVTFRNAHGWVSRGTVEAVFDHFYAALKPGGKLGLVQHMADPEQDWLSKNIGYVGREYIIAQAARAGFVLEAEGFFNRNALDNKRYEVGVWQLPPGLRNLKTDEEKAPYLAIGESERMTLVFRKPQAGG
ncbi:methyltransferase [Halioglobus maricola]|uniref:Methyltransferase n=1 Tax=Halioglobus maricola TaxID=2601894 RepID=A0A5P9NIX6_9GAMM|nr:class I SAM-dependent methyltransferase [Halioglobus maricola]QFU75790.1 methyltransferase [Halioglobus maricola]